LSSFPEYSSSGEEIPENEQNECPKCHQKSAARGDEEGNSARAAPGLRAARLDAGRGSLRKGRRRETRNPNLEVRKNFPCCDPWQGQGGDRHGLEVATLKR